MDIVKKWLGEVQRDWPDLWIPALANRGMESFLEHALQVGDLRRLVELAPSPDHFADAWGADEPRGVWRECPVTGEQWFDPDGAPAEYRPVCGDRIRREEEPEPPSWEDTLEARWSFEYPFGEVP